MVAVLTRVFGWSNSELIEDVVQDAFVKALHSWRFGMPENPQAWLMRTARNAAVDALRRKKFQIELPSEHEETLRSEYLLENTVDNLFLEHEIEDSVLRMMFTCCDPVLSEPDRIALTLKVSAGFTVDEVARALLLSPDVAKKRLQRARKKLADSGVLDRTFISSIPTGAELNVRLRPVLHVVYLIFNEGYGHSSRDFATRKDLCLESLRLAILLSRNVNTAGTEATALVALLSLLAARFESRNDENGNLIPLDRQDRTKLNAELVEIGLAYLARSAESGSRSVYQIEATIAHEHIRAKSVDTTDWKRIRDLYTALLEYRPTPIVQLNRAIAVGRAEDPVSGIEALQSIEDVQRHLSTNHLFCAALADMYSRSGDVDSAEGWYLRAIEQATFQSEKDVLSRRLQELRTSD